MKKVLFIAHAFYPSNSANAKRPSLTAKTFLEKGWAVDVVASDQGEPSAAKGAFSESAHCRVVRLKDPLGQLHRWLIDRGGRFFWKVDALLLALSWPDLSVIWTLKVARWLRNKEYDVIICSVHPKAVLMLPLLAKRLDVSWIIDYQDSVSAQFKRYPRKSPIHRLLTPVLTKIEKSALALAKSVVFTSKSNQNAYISDGLVNAEKTSFIGHFFEENLYDRSLFWDGNILNIVYAGCFDRVGRRTPEVFLKALHGFLEKCPEAKGKIRFDFYGRWWPEHNRFIENLGLQGAVSMHPAVPYAEYLKLLQTSAVLLLITAPVHNLFIPGKLVDYLGACRPILAFTTPDSETSGVLNTVTGKNYNCPDADVLEGIQVLEGVWKDYCNDRLPCSSAEDVAMWSSDKLVMQYVECGERAL